MAVQDQPGRECSEHSRCPSTEHLQDYWMGLLGQQQAFAVLERLAGCANCRRKSRQVRRQLQELRRYVAALALCDVESAVHQPTGRWVLELPLHEVETFSHNGHAGPGPEPGRGATDKEDTRPRRRPVGRDQLNCLSTVEQAS